MGEELVEDGKSCRRLIEGGCEPCETQEQFRAIIEAFDGFIYVCSRDYRIEFMNRKLIERTGYDARGERCYEVLHERDSICPWCVNERVFRGETVKWEIQSPKDNRWYYVVNAPIRHVDGTISKQAMILDITERKEAEQELARYSNLLEEMVQERTRDLREAQNALIQREKLKTLGAVSAEVAHQIRNPLTAIGGFAGRLYRKYPEMKELGIILAESDKLEKLLDRISSYLKPIPIRCLECSVDSVIEETLDLISPYLDDEHIGRELGLGSGLSPVCVDPAILSQILFNLVKNSTDVMDRKRSFVLSTCESDQNVNIIFTLPVLGSAEINPELLFLPFNGDQGQTIPICSRLIDAMGGSLNLTREDDRVVFLISFPKSNGARISAGLSRSIFESTPKTLNRSRIADYLVSII